jgi:cyanophycin synthetase
VLQETDDGELVALRHASRTMPLIYTHLIPATLGGRARMNVANALAAAAAAWAAGAHLHDIRQGLRTFSTSFFQAPGRLNEVNVHGFKVIIDYCHNVDGMRRLTEFVDLTMIDGDRRNPRPKARGGNGQGAERKGRAIGVIGIPGDRRDQDQREYGAIAARSFDEILVREDKNLRGRKPGEAAANVLEGIRQAQAEGARVQHAEPVLDELEAAKAGMRRARQGDLVVICADDSTAVYREAMALDRGERAGRAIADPGEFAVPEG